MIENSPIPFQYPPTMRQVFHVHQTKKRGRLSRIGATICFGTLRRSGVVSNGVGFTYNYLLKDHLGNTRVVFQDNGNGVAEVLSTSAYYPFGLEIEDLETKSNPLYSYLYNGKELDSNFRLNLYHYGARLYNPITGRFPSVDPLAANFVAWSPYSYTFNNPIRFIDPDGRAPDDIILGKGMTKPQVLQTFGTLQKLTDDKLVYNT